MNNLKSGLHSLLSEKFQELAKKAICNDALYTHVVPNCYLAGGAVLSVINHEPPKDLDIFFETQAAAVATLNILLRYTVGLTNLELAFATDKDNPNLTIGRLVTRQGVQATVTESINLINSNLPKDSIVKYVSQNAITLRNGLQFVIRFIGKPEEVFTTFDYEHCKVYFKLDPISSVDPVFLGRSLHSIATRELLFSGNTRFLLSAILRMNKFSKRGWGMHGSLALELMSSAAQVDWSSLEVVEGELTGVYSFSPQDIDTITKVLSTKKKFYLKDIVELVKEL